LSRFFSTDRGVPAGAERWYDGGEDSLTDKRMGKGFVKGLAAGALLGAVASIIMGMEENARDEKMTAVKKAASDISKRVMSHAKSLGKVSKAAYHKIVDTSVAEYRGAKSLSDSDIAELKKELKAEWLRLQKIMKKK